MISIDTRSMAPGDTYVAIRGEVHDGHQFVAAADALGADTIIVDQRSIDSGTVAPDTLRADVVVVDDTIDHLCREAAAVIAQADCDVIAITGSVGKTTTRTAVVAVLGQAFDVVNPMGNLNTPLGLSLTVLNAEITPDTKVVMEMGARLRGDITDLVGWFPPSCSVVTTIAPVHLETFGSIEVIEAEKGVVVDALGADGIAVLNGDDPRVRGLASRTAARVMMVGSTPPVDIDPSFITAELPILGRHAMSTAMLAAAVGIAMGMNAEAINAGLAAMASEPGRLVRLPGRHDTTLIDDTYNASPASVLAAIEVAAALAGRRSVAVLGDMLELGPQEATAHQQIVREAAELMDVLIVVGSRMADAVAHTAVDAIVYDDSFDAAAAIESWIAPGDVVLCKGSQGMRMERVSAAVLDPSIDPTTVLARQSTAWSS